MLAPENYQKFISYIAGSIPTNHHSCKILADVQQAGLLFWVGKRHLLLPILSLQSSFKA